MGTEIPFRSSPRSTLGVEMELAIVDLETRALTSASNEVLAVMGEGHPEGEHPKAKHELYQCTVEAITGICETAGEARADLAETLTELDRVTRARGMGVISTATHPFSGWAEQTVSPNPRYHALLERIGWPARRLTTHGTHYHVGVPSGPAAIAIANSLTYRLPVLLALSANSPFWNGHDTDMASARTKIFEGLPTAGLPPRIQGWPDFEQYMETLITAGAIESVRDVWWDVRPHPDFGTVELRMCDAMPTLDEVIALAALAQSLVADLARRFEAGEELASGRDWVIKENKWEAARYGLEADLVDDDGCRTPVRAVIEDLVDEVRPMADLLGCADELEGVADIVDRGAGYHRSRAVTAAGGTTVDVVDLLLEEFRSGCGAR
jgi:glutamate---cysteine ligase / carboxylate-amine ligase